MAEPGGGRLAFSFLVVLSKRISSSVAFFSPCVLDRDFDLGLLFPPHDRALTIRINSGFVHFTRSPGGEAGYVFYLRVDAIADSMSMFAVLVASSVLEKQRRSAAVGKYPSVLVAVVDVCFVRDRSA
jgi:hypothetical protein